MKKKIVEGNVGVIILKDSTDYAKSMALKDEKKLHAWIKI